MDKALPSTHPISHGQLVKMLIDAQPGLVPVLHTSGLTKLKVIKGRQNLPCDARVMIIFTSRSQLDGLCYKAICHVQFFEAAIPTNFITQPIITCLNM